MKAALLTALTVPLLFVGSGLAQAEPPPPIFTPEEQCDSTRGVVDAVRAKHPDATPEQIANAFVEYMDSQGAYATVPESKERDRQITLENIERCGL